MQLTAGAELDIASGAELAGHTDKLAKLLGKRDPRPLYLDFAASAIGSGAVVTLSIGSPPVGRTWNILAVTFVGNNDHGSIGSPAGFAAMYFGDPFNPSLGNLKHVKITLPSTVYPSSDALWCPAGQQVFFQTDLAVNSPDQVLVTVSLAEYRVRELEQDSGRP
jgi:hypothetical protein